MTELYSVAVKNNSSDRALQCSTGKQQQRQWQSFTVYKNKQQWPELYGLEWKTTAETELYSVAVKNNRSDRALQCSTEKQQQRQWQSFTVYKNQQQWQELYGLEWKTKAVTELYSVAVKNNSRDRALQCSNEKQQQRQSFTV